MAASRVVVAALGVGTFALLAGCASRGTKPEVPAAPAATSPGGSIDFVAPSADYPLEHCVVMPDMPLGADRVAVVYDGTEVQFCCRMCLEDFRRDPQKYVEMVRAAGK